MFLFKRQNRDHPVNWIGETKIRNAISDRARFVDVRLADENNRRDVAVASRERVSIDIRKIDSITFAELYLAEDRHQRRGKHGGREKNLRSTRSHD